MTYARIYKVVRRIPAPRDPKLRQLTNNTVAALLRHTTRSYVRATEQRGLVATGSNRNIMVHRYKAWLTHSKLAEVNKHLKALFYQHGETIVLSIDRDGQRIEVTLRLERLI